MSKIYYSPKGYWKSVSAIDKLAKEAEVSKEKAREWLKKASFVANLLVRTKVRP